MSSPRFLASLSRAPCPGKMTGQRLLRASLRVERRAADDRLISGLKNQRMDFGNRQIEPRPLLVSSFW